MAERILVPFDVQHESHDLEKFQAEGHFVCGLKDENGFRRDWETDEVHILTLKYAGNSPLAQGDLQILRVMSDTLGNAQWQMQRTIVETFMGYAIAGRTAQTSYMDWVTLNDKRNQFQMFVNAHYAREIETGQHAHLPTVFDVAVWYMRKERNRLWNRIGRLLRRQKLAELPEWVPAEWKQ